MVQHKISIFLLSIFFTVPVYCLEKDSICRAAHSPTDFGELLIIPEELKAKIESYRKSWRDFCDTGNRSREPLSALFAKAKEIENDFRPFLDTGSGTKQGESKEDSWARWDRLHDYMAEIYPDFIPGFEGSYIEWSFFRPSLKQFKTKSSLGNEEDQLFFDDFPLKQSPWIEFTWDYGGCTRYGEFDWIKQMQNLGHLNKSLSNKVYRGEVSKFEEGLIEILVRQNNICTCKEKTYVLQDLVKIQEHLKGQPTDTLTLDKITKKIKSIKNGELTINSEIEKHCSGG